MWFLLYYLFYLSAQIALQLSQFYINKKIFIWVYGFFKIIQEEECFVMET